MQLALLTTKPRRCDCIIVEVGGRRWCVRRYTDGGCGRFWVHSHGVWREA